MKIDTRSLAELHHPARGSMRAYVGSTITVLSFALGLGACDSSKSGGSDTQGGAAGSDGTDGGAADGSADGSSDGADGSGDGGDGVTVDGGKPTTPGVIGPDGIAAWDALPAAEQDRVRSFPILYLHQSVGQDLEDGCEANGFKFEYYGPQQDSLASGPNGGIFADVGPVPNGEPFQKMDVVRQAFALVKDEVRVFSFSFGYADVRPEDREAVQAEYQKLVGEVEAAGVRFLHVTPPIVYSPEENPPKLAMRAWMLETFTDGVIFDLQDIESLDNGSRCEVDSVWRICEANRSTEACPSKSQGIDGDGAGHLCETKAAEFAKALLYAYYQVSK